MGPAPIMIGVRNCGRSEQVPIFVQTPRQLFNLTLTELEEVVKPPEEHPKGLVSTGDWNLLTDSYEFLVAGWERLLPVARFAAGLRAGDDVTYAPDYTWTVGKLEADSEGFGAAFDRLCEACHSLSEVFDSTSEFRRLAREFREKVCSAVPSPQSLIAAFRWIRDTTEAISGLSRSTRAEAVVDGFNPDTSILGHSAYGPESHERAVMFDIDGVAWWASVLGLDCAKEFSEMASLGLADLPTPDWHAEDIIELSYHLSDARQMFESYFAANGLWPSVREGVATIEVGTLDARVVSRVPARFSEEDVWGLAGCYVQELSRFADSQETALLVLEGQQRARPIKTLERRADQFNRLWASDPPVGEVDPYGQLFRQMTVDTDAMIPSPLEHFLELRGYVRGVLEERQRRGDALATQTVQLLQEIRENQDEQTRRQTDQHHRVIRALKILEGELPTSWEDALRHAIAEAVTRHDWDAAVEDLLRKGASHSAEERLDRSHAHWRELGREARDNLQALEVLLNDYVPALAALATIGLFRALEPEFKAALLRAGVAVQGRGLLGDMVAAAQAQPAGLVRDIGTACDVSVVNLRNHAAHGDPVADADFQRVKLLILGAGRGLLWQLLKV
jgi:hypothetical protein